MLSPALLKVSVERDRRHSVLYVKDDSTQARRRKSTGLLEVTEEEAPSQRQHSKSHEHRRPSLLLMTEPTSTQKVRRHSSGLSGERAKESSQPVREHYTVAMFSKSTNFFGTASILKDNAAAKEAEKQRRRISNLRRESIASGPKTNVSTHQYTEDPTLAWEMLREKRPVKPVRQMKLDTPIKPDHVRFVCIGCTHGFRLDPHNIPLGDVLLIVGDFTTCGLPKEVYSFNKNLAQLKHSYKVVIAGNNECTFDESFLRSSNRETEAKEMALKQALQTALNSAKLSSPKPLITNGIYLEDSVIELFGITIYGTPWQPRVDNWAFNLSRGQPLLDKWNQIPAGVDVLLTHTPPVGHGDMMSNGQRMGCVELLNSVIKRIKPKYHVFSHIHEGYGCTSDGYTKFINCSQCNENLNLKNDPIIFDIPVHPHTKQFYIQNVKKILKRFQKQEKK